MDGHIVVSEGNSRPASSRSDFVSKPETSVNTFQQALSFHRQGHLREAEILYQQILEVDPNHLGASHFLGMIAFAQNNLEEAQTLVARSLELCDTKPIYFNNYGVILNEQKRHREAKDAFERALFLKPDYPDALSNLGLVTVLLDEPASTSESYFRSALRLQPNHCDAIRHLIELLLKNERHEDAIPLVERQLANDPENAEIEHCFACLYGNSGDIAQAKRHFQRAASLPGGKPVWRWKHLWYCPMFFESEEAIEKYWTTLNVDLDAAIAERPLYNWRTLVYDGFTRSFNLPHLNRCCKSVLEKFVQLFEPSFPFERPTYKPRKKIRVGFLVTPGHEGGFLRMMSGLIEQLDPGKLDVVLIYNETTASKYEGRFSRTDIVRIPYSWNFEEAVYTIKASMCDVIFYWKVGADVWSTFLPMCRLAPIQCTSWSTHGTSGLSQIDHYLSWKSVEPHDARNHYAENLYLFDTKPYFERKPKDIPCPASRLELGLPETGAIYFCLHRAPKYHPMFDDYLKQILERDPNGHIVMLLGKSSLVLPTSKIVNSCQENQRSTEAGFLNGAEAPIANPGSGVERLVGRLKRAFGEELFKRVIVLPHQPVNRYYKYLSASTVVLHSPIYSGEITTVDAFMYGVPCVAQKGKWLFQRYTSAFYDDFGIEGPSVSSKEEYVEQAVKFGTDTEYRKRISELILANHVRFFEDKKTVREWERFFSDAISHSDHFQPILQMFSDKL